MKSKLLIAIAVLLLMGHHASAQEAASLEVLCREASNTNNRLFCEQYFRGANDLLQTMTLWNQASGYSVPACLPDDGRVSADITRRLWLNFIDDNPKYLAKPVYLSYMLMMVQEYPCTE